MILIASTPISLFHCVLNLVYSNTLRKFPDLKIALSEGGIGWIPYFLERADYVYKHHKAWTHQDFGDKLPSDVFREHVVTCFIDDEFGVKNRHDVGIDTITWECDYPHSDTTWPNSPEILWESFEKVPDAEINAMTHENAMREFRLDFHASRPREKSTVGALRAESPDVDMAAIKNAGGTAAHEDGDRIVTGGDIMQQLAGAFVERN